MKCLIDYIGIMGCKTTIPSSGLYLNQLPGITLKSIDSIANEEQVTWLKVWNDVQARASRKFEAAVNRLFAKRYRLNTIVESHCLNASDYNPAVIANEGKWKGFILKVQELYNPTLGQPILGPARIDRNAVSAFQNTFISVLKLYSDTDTTTAIKIVDLDTSLELFETGSLNLVPGWNEIVVNRSFTANWMFVSYNATNVHSVNLTIAENTNQVDWYCNCLTCNYCMVAVSGAVSSDINHPSIVTAGTNSFGLSGCFNVSCSFESLVCKNKNLFADPWMNLLGSELMVERIYSERLNKYTTSGKKEAQELKDYFDTEFESLLKATVDGIQLDDNDCCFKCENGGIAQQTSIM